MSNSKTPKKLKASTIRLSELIPAMGASGKEATELIRKRYSKEIRSLTKDDQRNWSKSLSAVDSYLDSGRNDYALLYLFDIAHALGSRLSAHLGEQIKKNAKILKQTPLDNRNSVKSRVKEEILATASELHQIEENRDLDHFQLAELARSKYKRDLCKIEDADPITDGLYEEFRAEIPEVKFYENGTKKHDAIANWIKESDLNVKKPRRGRQKSTN